MARHFYVSLTEASRIVGKHPDELLEKSNKDEIPHGILNGQPIFAVEDLDKALDDQGAENES